VTDPQLIVVGQHLTVPAASGAATTSGSVILAPIPPPDTAVPPPAPRVEVQAALERWSELNSLDPHLAMGLAWHESGWHQDVVSATGAVGVMQLMPSAAAHVSQDLIGRPDLDRSIMEDNVRMGVRYLGQLLADFGGDERLALASYYEGEQAVRQIGVFPESEQFVANVKANRDLFASGG
jgi:soluble lytic murein transglycosylase-like protein